MFTVHEARAVEFRRAVRAYFAAGTYALTNLQVLCQTKIEAFAHQMNTFDVLCSVDECLLVNLDQDCWLAGWLEKRIMATFQQDLPLLTFGDLMNQFGDGYLARILIKCVKGLWGQDALVGIIQGRVHRSGRVTGYSGADQSQARTDDGMKDKAELFHSSPTVCGSDQIFLLPLNYPLRDSGSFIRYIA